MITVESRIVPGSGPLAALASVSGAAFERRGGERFLGFGERSNAADQTGRDVFSWAEEGPFSSGVGEDLLRPLIPEFTFPTGPAATNFPIPWTVTSRGFGFLIDQYERSTFRLASERDDAWQAEAEAPRFRFTRLRRPDPGGRVAPLLGLRRPPAEAGAMDLRSLVPADRRGAAVRARRSLPRRGRPGDRGADLPALPALRRAGRPARGRAGAGPRLPRARLQDHHLLQPARLHDLPAGLRPGGGERLVRPQRPSGSPTCSRTRSPPTRSSPRSTSPTPPRPPSWQSLLDEAIDDGFDGWMEDFGEYTPTDSHAADGSRGLELHNRYPVLYHCASYAHTRERMGPDAAIFIRSGGHGVQPCARIVWGGDPTEDWSCADGLCAAVHQALSTGLSGIAYWGSDIGGFHAIVNPRTSDELNARWLELGAFSGVMRTQANGFSFGDDRDERSQVWSPAVLPTWRRYAKLRTQLLPYIAAASRAYQRKGLPLTRHLALSYPNDPAAVAQQEQFMFGPDLLVAPVIEEGAPRTNALPAEGALGRPLALGLVRRAARRAPPRQGEADPRRPRDHGPGAARGDPTLRAGRHRAAASTRRRRHARRRRRGARPRTPGRPPGPAHPARLAAGPVPRRLRRGRKDPLARASRELGAADPRGSAAPDQAARRAWRRSPIRLRPCAVELDGRPLAPARWAYSKQSRSCGCGSPRSERDSWSMVAAEGGYTSIGFAA